ncbi:glycosyltransferase [Parvularcula lutaonensis]|uniref:Glycosyltransferase n=1 Tax=Parvularcula lutaonensis TaxID=491923 RepID=A0ABV7M8I0_9PROT|nr:glycosyltransferase [Parvularcula lutaonensis]GGY43978.1 colanic acid biosynthesis glycosyltransferase WcaL [Parvularcula lutaonensis]
MDSTDQIGSGPKVAYLLNTYPVPSGTFIRREIAALEGLGLPVTRYAVRPWDDQLVDPQDQAERDKTHYILNQGAVAILKASLGTALRAPVRFLKALGATGTLAKGRGLRAFAYLAEACYLRERTKTDGITHVHAHFGTNAAAVAMLCHLLGGPRYSFTVHGPDELHEAPLNAFEIKIAHADFVAAITDFARAELLRIGGYQYADKIDVIPCGLDLGDFGAQATAPEKPHFVCVGRLCPQKAQRLIPEAVAPIAKDHPDLHIELIGDGDDRPLIEAAIKRHGLERNITLTGWADNKKVRERILASRALLLPSFAEGLPIVIMEAFALRRPVISTYIAGIPELLDSQCGWIVPAGSVTKLRRAIEEAIIASPKSIEAMGREGRARIEARHQVQQAARRLAEHFQRPVS